MVRIVQVSDTHLSHRAPEATANWRAVVEHLAVDPPDLVVNTGDISLDGANDLDDLRFALREHTDLPAPWRVIPGNHDIGDVGETSQPIGSERRARFAGVFGDANWTTTLGGWRVIGIDIQAFTAGLGDSEDLWSWLDGALDTTQPSVLCMHRPLLPVDDGEVDSPHRYVNDPSRRRLRALIARSTVELVISGHVHQARNVDVDGRAHVWAPSTWATLPDDVQPTIGRKVVGIVEHTLDAEAHRSEVVVPDGVEQHVLGRTFRSPYSH